MDLYNNEVLEEQKESKYCKNEYESKFGRDDSYDGIPKEEWISLLCF